MNLCSKPYCARPGAVALGFDYSSRTAVLNDPPEEEISPHFYALCTPCAERLTPPRGWELIDLRTSPPLFVPEPEIDVGSLGDRRSPPADDWQLFGHSA